MTLKSEILLKDLQTTELKLVPELDPEFMPATKWNEAYRSMTAGCDDREFFSMALDRKDGTTSVFKLHRLRIVRCILSHSCSN